MRVLVCGGRHYKRGDLVDRQLDRLHRVERITVLIHGAATGADTLAGDWAKRAGVRVEAYPILPGEGGFNRNRRMLLDASPGLVVHFPGKRGTADMVRRAREARVLLLGGLEPPHIQMKVQDTCEGLTS